MSQTNEKFPPEVVLLEDLMNTPEKKDRIAKIKEAARLQASKTDAKQPHTIKNNEQPLYIELPENLPIEEMDLETEFKRLKILRVEKGLKRFKEAIKEEMTTEEIKHPQSDFDDVIDSIQDPLEDCEPEEDSGSESRNGYGKRIDPLQLGLAANQFITDIEEKEEIANRPLLAKLCVIREEARLVEM